jgi:hypothetical protein
MFGRTVNSATPWHTRMEPHGVIRIFSSPASWHGEAETRPLAAGWHANKFVNPANAGVVLPILRLNGFRIDNPTILARIANFSICSEAMAMPPVSPRGMTRPRSIGNSPRSRSGRCRHLRDTVAVAGPERKARASARASDHCAPPKTGPARKSSTASRSRAPGEPTRCIAGLSPSRGA